jgi:hypothetical protein
LCSAWRWAGPGASPSLPALIWCAIRYPLPLTCLLTFITGISEILLVANSLIHLARYPMQPWQLFSTRLVSRRC